MVCTYKSIFPWDLSIQWALCLFANISQSPQELIRPWLEAEDCTRQKGTFSELSVAVLKFSIPTPSLLPIFLFSLLKFNTNKHNRCTLFSVPLFCIQSTRLLNSALSPPLLLCSPMDSPPAASPIPFTSRTGEAVFACSPNPCLSYEIRTETLWNFYSSSPAVQSGNTEQKEAFVFVVWFLKRNMDSSP